MSILLFTFFKIKELVGLLSCVIFQFLSSVLMSATQTKQLYVLRWWWLMHCPPETLFLAAKMGYGKTSWILRVSWGLVCFWNCIFYYKYGKSIHPFAAQDHILTVLWKTLFCYYRHSDRDFQSCSAALKTGTHLGIQWAYFDPGATTTISVFLCHPCPHYQSHLSPINQ